MLTAFWQLGDLPTRVGSLLDGLEDHTTTRFFVVASHHHVILGDGWLVENDPARWRNVRP